MIVLAIETSCDETAVSIVKSARGKSVRFEVLSHKVLSQTDLHAQYGGVFPALAKREHAKAITQLIAECLEEADLLVERTNTYKLEMHERNKLEDMLSHEKDMLAALTILFEGIQKPKLDAIAVTRGPGLEPALWVGINAARALNSVWDIPLYPINHMEGHVVTGALTEVDGMFEITTPTFPAVALLISGGHTEFVRIPSWRSYTLLGATKDDAVGEAFDKVARMLGLPYPGGPHISKLAEQARRAECVIPDEFKLPRPMLHSGDLAMSFSGLKTAVMTRAKKYDALTDEQKMILALSFENAVTDVLVAKTKQALYEAGASTLIIGGGVSANTHIRNSMKDLAQEEGVDLYIPDKKLSGDNGLMIAATALLHIHNQEEGCKKPKDIRAEGGWSITHA